MRYIFQNFCAAITSRVHFVGRISVLLCSFLFVLVTPASAVYEFVCSIKSSGGDYSTLSDWETAIDANLTSASVRAGQWDNQGAGGAIADGTSIRWDGGASSGTLYHMSTVAKSGVNSYMILVSSGSLADNDTVYDAADATKSFDVNGAPDSVRATAKIEGTWSNADSTAVTIDGWTTSATNYIDIYATGSARHTGVWSDTAYRITSSGAATIIIANSVHHVRIRGLQVENSGNPNGIGIDLKSVTASGNTARDIYILSNIVRKTAQGNSDTADVGIYLEVEEQTWFENTASKKIKIINNIIYDFHVNANQYVGSNTYLEFNNNTMVGGDNNWRITGCAVGCGTRYITNNLIASSVGNGLVAAGSVSSGACRNNASTDATISGCTDTKSSITVSFLNATADDYHIAVTETDLIDLGTSNASYLGEYDPVDDVDGDSRSGRTYDIGADEVASAIWDNSSGDGNWNTASNWVLNAVPGANDIVTFNATSTGNCAINANVNVRAFMMNSGYAGTITQGAGYTITVGEWGFTKAAGTFTGGDSNIDINGPLAISSGTFTNTSATLSVSGNMTLSPGITFTKNGGSVLLDGNLTYTDSTATKQDIGNLTIGVTSDTVTLASDMAATSLTVASGNTFDLDGYEVDIGGAVDLNGVIDATNGTDGGVTLNVAGSWDATSGTFTNTGSTVIFDSSTADQTITSDGESFYTLTFNNTAASGSDDIILADTLDVNGALTITDGDFTLGTYAVTLTGNWAMGASGSLDEGTGTVTFDGAADQTITSDGEGFYSVTLNNTGAAGSDDIILADALDVNGNLTITNGDLDPNTNNTNITVAGNWTIGTDGSLDEGTETVTFDGAADQTITSDGEAFYSVTFNNTGGDGSDDIILADAFDVNGNLTITNGDLDPNTNNINMTVAGNWTVGTDGSLDEGTETVTFDGAADQTITSDGEGFYSVTLNNTGAAGSDDIILADALDVNGNLTITNGDLDLNTNNVNMTVAGNWTVGTDGSLDEGTETVTFDGAADQTITSDGEAFYSVTLNNTGGDGSDDIILADAFDVNGNLTITNGDLDPNTNNVNMTVAGNWTVGTDGSLDEGTETVTFDGAADQTITSDGEAFYSVTLNNTGGDGSDDIILADAFDVNGNLTITNGDLDPNTNNTNITVAGNWTMGASGSLDEGTETVTFDGAADQTITSDGEAFYAVVINNVGDADADDITFADAFDANGAFTLTNGQLHLETNNPNVNIAGNITIGADGTVVKGTGTVIFDGDLTYTDNAGSTNFGSIAIGTSPDTTNLATDFIADALTINTGDQFITNGYEMDIANTLDVNGTLDASGTGDGGTTINIAGNWDMTGGTFISINSIVLFDGTSGTKTITSDGESFYSITFNDGGGSATFQLGDALDVNGTLTITGGTLDTTGSNLSVTVDQDVVNADIFNMRGSTITVGDDWTSTGTNTYGTSTVDLIGNATITTSGVDGRNFYNLNVAADGMTTALAGHIYVNGTLTLADGTFDGNWSADHAIFMNATAATIAFSGTDPTIVDAYIAFGGNNGTIPGLDYDDAILVVDEGVTVGLGGDISCLEFRVNNWGGDTLSTFNTNDHAITTGLLLLGHAYAGGGRDSVFNAGASTIDVNGDVLVESGSGTTINAGTSTWTVSGDWDMNGESDTAGAVFNPGNSTITLNGAADQTVTSDGESFYGLTFNNTGAGGSDDIILADALDVNSTLTITNGDLDPNTNNVNITVGLDWVMGADGSLDEGTETVTFDGTTDQAITSHGEAFYAVTFNNTGVAGSDDITLSDALVVGGALTVTDGAVDFSDQAVTINGSTAINGGSVKTGTGAIAFGDAAGDSVTMSAGTLDIESDDTDSDITRTAGTWTNSGGTISFVGSGSTVEFSGIQTYYNLVLNSAGNSFVNTTNIDVNGTFTLTAGTLDLDTNDRNMNIAGNISIGSDGDVTPGSGTVTFDGDLTYTDTDETESFGDVVIGSSPDTTTLASDFIANSLTISTGDMFITDGYEVDIANTMDINGTLNATNGADGNTTINVGGNWDSTGGTFTSTNSTTIFDATDAGNTITSDSESFYTVQFNDGGGDNGGWSLTDALDVDDSLTVTATDSANGVNFNGQTVTIGTDFTIASAGEVTAGASSISVGRNLSFANTAGIFNYDTSTVYLTGSGTISTSANNYLNNLVQSNGVTTTVVGYVWLTGNGTTTGLFTTGDATSTIQDNGVDGGTLRFLAGSTVLHNGATWSSSAPSDRLILQFYNSGRSFPHASSTSGDFGDTEIITSATITQTRAVSTGRITIDWEDGTWNTNNYDLDSDGVIIGNSGSAGAYGTFNAGSSTITITNDLTINNNDAPGSTFNAQTSTVSIGGDFTNNDVFVPGTGTVVFNGTADQTVTLGTGTFFNFTTNNTGASGSDDIILADALDVNGTITVTNGDLDANTNDVTINVAGNWAMGASGTFDYGASTVVFDGTNQSVSGSTTFYNFSKTESANDATDETLTFDNTATQTIAGLLTLDGRDDDDRINLVSDSPGDRWNLTANGTFAIDYVDVTDSDASGGTIIVHTNTVNSGNNLNWGFYTIYTWDGSESSDWADPDNWDVGSGYPSTIYDKAIITTDGTDPISPVAGVIIGDLEIQGGILTLAGTLTVDDSGAGDGSVTISGGTLNAAGYDVSVDGNWTNSATYTSGANTTTFAGTTTLTTGGTGAGQDFNNVTISGTVVPATNNVDIDGTLTISTGGHLNNATNDVDITVGVYDGSGAVVINGGTLSAGDGTVQLYGNWTLSSGTFNANSGTVNLSTQVSTTDFTVSGVTTFYNLIVEGVNTHDLYLNDNIVVDNDFTVSVESQFFDINSQSGELNTISVGGNVLIDDAGKMEDEVTIVMNGSAAQAITTTDTGYIGSLQISNTSDTVSLASNLLMYGSLTIDTGAELDVTATNYSITNRLAGTSGYWTVNGTFTQQQGTVDFYMTGDASQYTISSATTFYNLTVSGNSNRLNVSEDVVVQNDLTITNTVASYAIFADGTETHSIFVAGDVVHSGRSSMENDVTIVMNGTTAQTITISDGSIGGLRIANTSATVTAGSDLDIAGPVTIDAGAVFDVSSNNYPVTVSWGGWTNNGMFVQRAGTVEFLGHSSFGSQITITGATTFYSLTFSGTPTTARQISDDLIVEHDLLFSGAGAVNADGSDTHTVSVAGDVVHSGTFRVDADLMVVMNGTTVQTVATTSTGRLGDLRISNTTAEVQLVSTLMLFDDLTIDSGATFDLGSYGIEGSNYWTNPITTITNNGTLQLSGDQDIQIYVFSSASYTALTPTNNSGSTVEYTATSGSRAIKDWTYEGLHINGNGGTFTMGAGETVNGNLIVQAGTFDVSDQALTVNGNTTISGGTMQTGTGAIGFGNAAGDTVTISSGALTIESDDTDADITRTAGTWTNSGGTISFVGSGSTSVFSGIQTYYNLVLNSSGNTFTNTTDIDVNGTFTLTAGTLDLDTNDRNMNIAGNISIGSDGDVTPGSGTVTFDGDLTYTDTDETESFGDVTIGSSPDTTTLASDFIANSLTISTGDMFITDGYEVDIANTMDMNGTLNASSGTDGATTINVGGIWDMTGGTFTTGLSTVIFDGGATARAVTSDGESFFNLQIGSDGAGSSLDIADTLDINGTLTVANGGETTFNIANDAVTIAGDLNLTNLDVFTVTSSTVTLNGTAAQTVTSNSLTYNTLSVTNSAAAVTFADPFTTATFTDTTAGSSLLFNAGDTYTITGTLTLVGASGNEITLDSDDGATQFIFDVTGADQNVAYLEVSNSAASTNDIVAGNSTSVEGNDDGEASPHWVFNASGSPLYRSVGTNGADLDAAVNGGYDSTVEIVGNTATFSGSGVQSKVGVGDVVQYQVTGTYHVAFITARTSANVFTVQGRQGGAPQAAVAGTAVSIYRAFTELDDWEDYVVGDVNSNIHDDVDDLVLIPSQDLSSIGARMMVPCYADGEDATTPVIDGWTTAAENYIKIYTPTSATEVGTTQRHNGTWGNGYRTTTGVYIYDEYVRIDGLADQNGSNSSFWIGTAGAGEIQLSNCYGHYTGDGNIRVYDIYDTGARVVKIWNSIGITDSTSTSSRAFYPNDSDIAFYCYNCTGIANGGQAFRRGAGTATLKNCLGYSASATELTFSGTWSAITYSATDDTSLVGGGYGATNRDSQTFSFVSSATDNYHLSAGDAGARDHGTDASDATITFSDDIDGQARPIPVGGDWDIGADEAAASSGNAIFFGTMF